MGPGGSFDGISACVSHYRVVVSVRCLLYRPGRRFGRRVAEDDDHDEFRREVMQWDGTAVHLHCVCNITAHRAFLGQKTFGFWKSVGGKLVEVLEKFRKSDFLVDFRVFGAQSR